MKDSIEIFKSWTANGMWLVLLAYVVVTAGAHGVSRFDSSCARPRE
jgi:hypothetical protein